MRASLPEMTNLPEMTEAAAVAVVAVVAVVADVNLMERLCTKYPFPLHMACRRWDRHPP